MVDSDGVVKRQNVYVLGSFLTWKKLVTSSAKKSVKKVNPKPPTPRNSEGQLDQRNNENKKKSQPPVVVITPGKVLDQVRALSEKPVATDSIKSLQKPSLPAQTSKLSEVKRQPSRGNLNSPGRQIVIQASTGELLQSLDWFVHQRCTRVQLGRGDVILWFRNADRTLLMQGWQECGFITPANLVFVYMLCKDTIYADVDCVHELHGVFLNCLYLAYSYMGQEISYPIGPFMIGANKDVFWDRTLDIINRNSAKMLQLNSDPHFFTEVFQELKDVGETEPPIVTKARRGSLVYENCA